MDHHIVAHINTHMARSRRIIGSLEEDQISRLCVRRGNLRTAAHQSIRGLPADIPAIAAVIDHPAHEA